MNASTPSMAKVGDAVSGASEPGAGASTALVQDARSSAQQQTFPHPGVERGEAVGPGHRVACANCGATISDRYCGHCGQRFEPHIHSLGHFLAEAAENLTHADSRVWQTLWPLLVKPGFLTQEFLAGRRASQLPPFRLYLVVSAIFFLLWALLPASNHVVVVNPRNGIVHDLTESARASAAASKSTEGVESDEARTQRICADMSYQGPWQEVIGPRVAAACGKVLYDHGDRFVHVFIANIPKALFVLIPALAAMMKLMYWRPKRYYVEHLLFFVHNHAAVFLLMSLAFLANYLLGRWISADLVWCATFLYVLYYAYVSMRNVYGQSQWARRIKFSMLSLVYLTGASILVGMIAVYSVLTI